MDRDHIHAAIAQERRGIADLIDSLYEAQLATESLCTGWDVKTVGASGEHSGRGHSQGYVAWRRRVVRIGQSMSWHAAARSGQLPKSRQVCATSLIINTGGPRRKPLVC